ncbi:hypothetical protein N0V90_012497 [Kalmusia sp. IMI 367209]|nr:hypothetical protein N0V90_012497 [Kalmusia sp. IMI 367209]
MTTVQPPTRNITIHLTSMITIPEAVSSVTNAASPTTTKVNLLSGFAYPTPATHTAKRDELSAAMAANAHYDPLKVFLAVSGVVALILLLTIVGWFAWSAREKKAVEERNEKAFADLYGMDIAAVMDGGVASGGAAAGASVGGRSRHGEFGHGDVEAKGGERKEGEKNRLTRWSFGGYFAK